MKTLETHTASEVASRITYTGSGIGAFFGLGGIDWIAWIGVLIAMAGFIANLFFKIREDRRNAELHRMKIQQMKGENHEP